MTKSLSAESKDAIPVTLTVNGRKHDLRIDPRTSLLDCLREHLHLTGTKKGCDHEQCGTCTVLINGRRINSCLTLAVMHQDDDIVTIEGLGSPGALHPMQAAFVECDGSMRLLHARPDMLGRQHVSRSEGGWPSHATADVASARIALTDAEIREPMSGNICRCAAYPNIVAFQLSREKRLSPRRAPKRSLLPLSPRRHPGSPNTTPANSVWPSPELAQPAEASPAQEYRLRLKQPHATAWLFPSWSD